jgi:hypothetical protein
VYELAREVGRAVAEADGLLICGGRGGVMEAAARGAKEAGGLTIGILPGDSDTQANPFIDIPIVTGMGFARNTINVLTCHAVIAIHGAFGTLSEIAFARVAGIPVIGLETWSLKDPAGETPADMAVAPTPREAVRMALQAARRRIPGLRSSSGANGQEGRASG